MNEARNRRPARLATLALALSVLGALPAAAQDRSGSWEITPNAGGFFGGKIYDGYQNGTFRGQAELGTAPTYGGKIAYNFTRYFAVEGSYTYADPSVRLEFDHSHSGSGSSTNPQDLNVGHVKLNIFEVDAVFNMGKGPVIGYISLGPGGMAIAPSAPGARSDTRFTTNFGGGVKFFFTPHVAFRVDGRWRSTNTGHSVHGSTWCDYYGYCYSYSTDWATTGSVTGGLTFAF